MQRKDILDVNRELRALNFTPQAVLTKLMDELEANLKSIIVPEEGEEEQAKEKEEELKEGEFDYLMNMAIKSFTNKKIRELNDTLAKIEHDLQTLNSKSEQMLWIEDLDALEDAYKKFFETWKKEHEGNKKKKVALRKVKKNKAQKKGDDKEKDKDKKGPKPKRLPGFEDDTTQDTAQKKQKKEGDDESDNNSEKKPKKQKKKKDGENAENVENAENAENANGEKEGKVKKERKPRVKKEPVDSDEEKPRRPKKQEKKRGMSDVESDSGSMGGVVSEGSEDSFKVQRRNQRKNKKINQDEE